MRTPAELRKAYEEGATVLELAQDEGIYEGKIRYLLAQAGTKMRPKGARPGTDYNLPRHDPKIRPTGVHQIGQLGGPPRKGYRRRGRNL